MESALTALGVQTDASVRENKSAQNEEWISCRRMRAVIASGATVWEFTEVRGGGFTLEVKLRGRKFITEGTRTDLARLFGGQTGQDNNGRS